MDDHIFETTSSIGDVRKQVNGAMPNFGPKTDTMTEISPAGGVGSVLDKTLAPV